MPLIPNETPADALSSDPASYERRLMAQAQRDPDVLMVLAKRQSRIPFLKPTKKSIWDSANPWENIEAADVADYLARRTDLFLWHHIPNERSGQRQRAQLGMMGVRAGQPDYSLDHSFTLGGQLYHGLKIELKRRKGGTVSKQQRVFLNAYQGAGWVAEVCRGAGQAVALIELCYGKGWLT